jgi:DNA helicase-2/ATP-dependent DNA helicase PcrA
VRLIANKNDDEALLRIINYPTRGIGDVTKENIRLAAQQAGSSMWEMINTVAKQPKVLAFRDLINSLTECASQTNALDALREIVTRSGIFGQFSMSRTPENVSALENIEELINSAKEFVDSINDDEMIAERSASLTQWLENVSLMTDEDNDDDNNQNYVTLMTIHSAKGLEFDNVYVVGLENNLFPSRRSFESASELEEERRLFYVAITRARTRLMLSYCGQRFQWGDMATNPPSLFLKEIDPQYLDVANSKPDENRNTQDRVSPIRQFDYGHRNIRSIGAATSSDTTSEITQTGDLSIGCRVLHDKFGQGRVVAIKNSTAGLKVSVEFDQVGCKDLLTKFAKLKVIG